MGAYQLPLAFNEWLGCSLHSCGFSSPPSIFHGIPFPLVGFLAEAGVSFSSGLLDNSQKANRINNGTVCFCNSLTSKMFSTNEV